MAIAPALTGQPISHGERSRLRILTSRANIAWLIGSVILLAAGAVGVIIQVVPSLQHLYLNQDLEATLKPPLSPHHLLGTDNLGRDLGWQLIAGLGTSLAIGIGVALLSVVLGLIVGIFGGFFGRAADAVANVVVDVTWAFPAILLAVVLAGWIGPSLTTVILALALTNWAGFARIVRGEVLSLRERDFVNAARVLGVPKVVISVQAPCLEHGAGHDRAHGLFHRHVDHWRGRADLPWPGHPAADAEHGRDPVRPAASTSPSRGGR